MITVANRGTITPIVNLAGRVLDEVPTKAGKTGRTVLIIPKIRGIKRSFAQLTRKQDNAMIQIVLKAMINRCVVRRLLPPDVTGHSLPLRAREAVQILPHLRHQRRVERENVMQTVMVAVTLVRSAILIMAH